MSSESSHVHWTRQTVVRLRRYFLAGLASVLPIVVTIYLVMAVFRFADGPLGKFVNRYWRETFGYAIPGLGLAITLLLIVGTGAASDHFLAQRLLRWLDASLSRLPVARHIYPFIKQIGQSLPLQGNTQTPVLGVVLVEYPRRGCHALAVVTNQLTLQLERVPNPVVAVLVIHANIPFTGPLLFVPKDAVIPVAVTLEEVAKFSVSAGVMTPLLNRLQP